MGCAEDPIAQFHGAYHRMSLQHLARSVQEYERASQPADHTLDQMQDPVAGMIRQRLMYKESCDVGKGRVDGC